MAQAKKCRYCGEWLNEGEKREGSGAGQRGTSDARAVSKGLKEKEFQEQMMTFIVGIVIVASIIIGFYTSFVGGIIAFAVLFVLASIVGGGWYWKE